MRIQFDIDEETVGRAEKLYPGFTKMRHMMAHRALVESINRQEGRNRRAMHEKDEKERAALRPLLKELVVEVMEDMQE